VKSDEAAQVLSLLTAGFHRESLEEATIELWLEVIEPQDAALATKVALDWIKNEDRFPTVSQFRHAYHVARRQADPHELSAAHDVPADLGLGGSECPQWVMRWLRRFKVVSAIADPDRRAQFEDWRVFPEQIVGETRYVDDPRFTRAEAEALGVMPEDAWLETA
jgi:hypothetical protein